MMMQKIMIAFLVGLSLTVLGCKSVNREMERAYVEGDCITVGKMAVSYLDTHPSDSNTREFFAKKGSAWLKEALFKGELIRSGPLDKTHITYYQDLNDTLKALIRHRIPIPNIETAQLETETALSELTHRFVQLNYDKAILAFQKEHYRQSAMLLNDVCAYEPNFQDAEQVRQKATRLATKQVSLVPISVEPNSSARLQNYLIAKELNQRVQAYLISKKSPFLAIVTANAAYQIQIQLSPEENEWFSDKTVVTDVLRYQSTDRQQVIWLSYVFRYDTYIQTYEARIGFDGGIYQNQSLVKQLSGNPSTRDSITFATQTIDLPNPYLAIEFPAQYQKELRQSGMLPKSKVVEEVLQKTVQEIGDAILRELDQ